MHSRIRVGHEATEGEEEKEMVEKGGADVDKIAMQRKCYLKKQTERLLRKGPLCLHSTNKIIGSDDRMLSQCALKWRTVKIRSGEIKYIRGSRRFRARVKNILRLIELKRCKLRGEDKHMTEERGEIT